MRENDPAFFEILGLMVLAYNKVVGRGIERDLTHPFAFLLLFVCHTHPQSESAKTLDLQVARSVAKLF